MDPENTTYRFSQFTNLYSVKNPEAVWDIDKLVKVVKEGHLMEVISKLRKTSNKTEYNKIKQSEITCVTISGIFTERNREHLVRHSGLIQIDIDDVPKEEYKHIFENLCHDYYTHVAFRSPGGKGIKAIVKINPSQETHLCQFLALQEYYKEEYGVTIDGSCKDISRCMLLSYDPNLYFNPNSEVFEVIHESKPKYNKLKKQLTGSAYVNHSDDIEQLVSLISEQLVTNHIDITEPYENWIKIGFSLASALGESGRTYFHKISSVYSGYNAAECDKQYSYMLSKNTGEVSIGTLIYLAKENGVSFVSQIDKTINKKEAQASLYDKLKKQRLEIAKKRKQPAFIIFPNKVLDQLVKEKPDTVEKLSKIKGIGKVKIKEFGDDILKIINEI